MPNRIAHLPGVRTLGQGTAVIYTFSLIAVRITGTGAGGFSTSPSPIPDDLDPTYPIDVFAWFTTPVNVPAGGVVILQIEEGHGQDPNTAAFTSIQEAYIDDGSWLPGEIRRLLMDNGNGHTFDAAHFDPADVFGMSLRRVGTNPGDTYTGDVDLFMGLECHYHRRCQKICC